jgi:hypothetical protein
MSPETPYIYIYIYIATAMNFRDVNTFVIFVEIFEKKFHFAIH